MEFSSFDGLMVLVLLVWRAAGFEERCGVVVASGVGIVNQLEFLVVTLFGIFIGGQEISNFYWTVIVWTPIYVVFALLAFHEAIVPTGFARYSATFAVCMAQNMVYQAYNDVSFNGMSPKRAWWWIYSLFFIVNNFAFYFETQQQRDDALPKPNSLNIDHHRSSWGRETNGVDPKQRLQAELI